MQKYRKEGDISYALGTELTLELLKTHPEETERVYVHSKQKDNEIARLILSLCRQHNIEVVYSDKAFNIVNAKENCYLMGVFRKYDSPIDPAESHIVLVNPGNMGNLGTIIRTMTGFGLKDLAIITPAVDIFDPKVIRASMRAFFEVNISLFASFEDYLMVAKPRPVFPFMLDGAVKLQEVEKPAHYSLVFGNEATGLPAEYHEYGQAVVIPHLDTIDSLNLDNAASIAIYEFTREKFR